MYIIACNVFVYVQCSLCSMPSVHYITAASSPGKDFGFIYQRYSLSKAVVALCKKTDNVSLEELVQILLSNFYSFQSAACILAKR